MAVRANSDFEKKYNTAIIENLRLLEKVLSNNPTNAREKVLYSDLLIICDTRKDLRLER